MSVFQRVSKQVRWVVALIAAAVIVLPATFAMPASTASAAQARYFPNTGNSVGGAFLKFFDAYGGVRVFGLPLTNETQENGRTVQYFERQRFEYFPEYAGSPNEVQLGLLGARAAAGKPGAGRIAPFTSKKDRVYFNETGHSLSGAFLSFWKSNGGVRVLGFPITEPIQEGGWTVQYFERARMEYHPEKAKQGFVVELSLLGRDYLWSGGAGLTTQPPAQAPAPQGGALNGLEQELLNHINGARTGAGLAPVAADAQVSALSKHRSNDMVHKGYFSHTPPGGDDYMTLLKRAGVPFKYAGEILAVNSYSNSAQKAFEGFMNSPAHRAIIMDGRYNIAGVGQALNSQGENFYTVIFVQK
ncbi:MAG: CAP domain-containing protein [Chloroflexota bacterium]|nr:CAP domain-containing protein [Chloroflexota bacterium]MDQ5867978.1 CAP domain-containing protein [Chloroflexota bacterium]